MEANRKIFIPSISPGPLRVVTAHEGGFSRVYIVESEDNSYYAIKTLKWEQGHDKNQLRQEALKLAAIPHHPHIIDIIGIEWIDGHPFMILPYYRCSLADTMSGRLDRDIIRQYAKGIASGLSFLHDHVGILHLDLKPQNVLLDSEGKCLLSDFGLSRCLPKPSPYGLWKDVFVSGLTGTIAYMSPEHFVSGQLSAKSDVFAMGVILYEMITRKHPFMRSSMEATVRSILFKKPKFPFFSRESGLVKICKQCLDKNPEHRPSAKDLVHLLNSGTAADVEKIRSLDLSSTINRATAYLEGGDINKAEELLLLCLQHQPWSLCARINLAEVYLLSNRHDKARAAAKEALDLSPWCPEEKDSLPTLLTNIACMYLAVDPHESLKFARQAIVLSPNDWQAIANAAEACRLLAEEHTPEFETFIKEGFAYADKSLSINPQDIKSQIIYANLLLLKRDFARLCPLVLEIMNKAKGDNVPACVLLIRTLTATGQLEDAESWLEPMTKYPSLKGVCDTLRADLDKRRNEIRKKNSAQ